MKEMMTESKNVCPLWRNYLFSIPMDKPYGVRKLKHIYRNLLFGIPYKFIGYLFKIVLLYSSLV